MTFTFLPGEVVFGQEIVRDLDRWEWSARFAAGGIERLEVNGPVSEAQFGRFLGRAAGILGIVERNGDDLWQDGPDSIRFGRVRVNEAPPAAASASADSAPPPRLETSLREEGEAIRWLHQDVEAGRPMPVLEAYTVVRSLSLAMHGGQAMVMPLLQLKEFDQYTTTHSINVSVLAMALAEFTGMPAPAVRTYGLAGLLHDLGKVRIPHEILTKPGKLTRRRAQGDRGAPGRRRAHPARSGARPWTCRRRSPTSTTYVTTAADTPACTTPATRTRRAGWSTSAMCTTRSAPSRPYRDAWSSEDALDYIDRAVGHGIRPGVRRVLQAT